MIGSGDGVIVRRKAVVGRWNVTLPEWLADSPAESRSSSVA